MEQLGLLTPYGYWFSRCFLSKDSCTAFSIGDFNRSVRFNTYADGGEADFGLLTGDLRYRNLSEGYLPLDCNGVPFLFYIKEEVEPFPR